MMEPASDTLTYDPYLSHYPQLHHSTLPPGIATQLQSQQPYSYQPHEPGHCQQSEILYQEQFDPLLEPGQPPLLCAAAGVPTPAPGYEDLKMADSEMMETVDSQHGFVLVK